MVTVDIIFINIVKNKILLIERGREPYKNYWALPGGFVDMDEELEDAAYRELKEETNVDNISLSQFKTYGTLGRDPRGRTISIIYYAITEKDGITAKAGDDAAKAEWFDIKSLPKLIAFDHRDIINDFICSKRL
jgi:8-oxo-dGTP diphosphatase